LADSRDAPQIFIRAAPLRQTSNDIWPAVSKLPTFSSSLTSTIHNPPFDSPTLSSSKKKRAPPKMDNFTCKQLGQNEGHVQNVSSHNSE
jgi:hypothetical protein